MEATLENMTPAARKNLLKKESVAFGPAKKNSPIEFSVKAASMVEKFAATFPGEIASMVAKGVAIAEESKSVNYLDIVAGKAKKAGASYSQLMAIKGIREYIFGCLSGESWAKTSAAGIREFEAFCK